MPNYERSLDSVIDTLRNTRGGCSLLIGAGVSFTAEIPLAMGFVRRIAQKFPAAHRRADPKNYPKCMAELTIAQRHELIKEAVDASKVNWAHVAMAQLIKTGRVTRVLTTNFDPLVMRACALCGVYPAIYDFATSEKFRSEFVSEPAIYHLHGQHSGFVQLHTEKEVNDHFKRLKPVFEDAGTGRPWIVVGYSGENDPVFEHLAKVKRFNHGLHWIGYRDDEPPRHVREKLLQPDKDAWYVRGHDADSFFVELARALQCFPPDFVDKPFSHLKSGLEQLTEFRLNDQPGPRIVDITRTTLDKAIQQFETGSLVGEPLRNFFEGNNAAVEELESQDASENAEVAVLKAWALLGEGKEFYFEAQAKSGADADHLFGLAGEKYAQAVAIQPDMHDAFNNWGCALSAHAETKSGAEADRLFDLACEKYAQAVAIQPNKHNAFNNWGYTLSAQAKRKNRAEADRLFDFASEKYAQAVAIHPDMYEGLYNWGNALSDQAKRKHGSDADRLFDLAGEKYAQAVDIQPADHTVFNNWGNVLADQAKTKSEADADRLFDLAGEKYAQSLAIKPDKHEAFNNWGSALLAQATTKSGSDADRLFAEARAKCEAAERIQPGSGAYNLACIAALTQQPDECRRWLTISREAGQLPNVAHLKADSDLDAVRDLDWFTEFIRESETA